MEKRIILIQTSDETKELFKQLPSDFIISIYDSELEFDSLSSTQKSVFVFEYNSSNRTEINEYSKHLRSLFLAPYIFISKSYSEEDIEFLSKFSDSIFLETPLSLNHLELTLSSAFKCFKNKIKLLEIQNRYISLFEQNETFILILDSDLKIIEYNKTFLTFLDITPDDLVNCKLPDFTNEENIEFIIESFEELKHFHSNLIEFVPLISKNGERKNCRLYISRFLDTNSSLCYQVVGYDLSLLIESNNQLQSKYENLYQMFRLMTDNMPDLLWAKDLNRNYLFANKAITDRLLFAENTEEPIGKNDLFFVNRIRAEKPDDSSYHTFGEICRDSDSIVMKSMKAQRFDEYGNVKGKFLFLDVYKAPLFNNDGKMIGTVGCGRDVTKEKKLEEDLDRENVLLRATWNASLNALRLINKEGLYIYVNQAYCDLVGKTVKELIGQPFNIIYRSQHPNDFIVFKEKMQNRSMELLRECSLDLWDGKDVWVKVQSSFLEFKEEPYLLSVFLDINDIKLYEEKLLNNLHEKEILLREVHHRVKNNLQIINSLINLQSYKIDDPEIKEYFTESCNRVRSMAVVHEKLYNSDDFTNIYISGYIEDLVGYLSSNYSHISQNIKIIYNIENVKIHINKAIPVGLIINELITNAFKYAFPDNRKGTINISLSHIDDKKVILRISDDGIGLPENFDFYQSNTLGYELIDGLTKQINGSLSLSNNNGADISLTFQLN